MYSKKFSSRAFNTASLHDGNEVHKANLALWAGEIVPKYSYSLNLNDRSVTVYANTPRALRDARNQIRQQADDGKLVFSLIGYDRFAKCDDGEIMVWFVPDTFKPCV